MKAILMHGAGGPEVLREAEVARPEINSEHQVLVRVRAAGVNPVDTKLRGKGTYYPNRDEAILGCDGAGVIEEVGMAVSRFSVGDEVYYCDGGIGGGDEDAGSYAEYKLIDERLVARKPESIGFAEAAAAPLVLITAWESLYDRAGVKPGDSVLVHAGAGGVGHVAIQLAKAAGCTVFTTVSSDEKAEIARALGADAAINYTQQDFAKACLYLTDGQGVDAVIDTVGGKTTEKSFAALKPYGELVTLLQPDCDLKTARLRNQRISLELMLSPMFYRWQAEREHQAGILEQCAVLFDEGRLRIQLSDTLPLAEAAEAHRRIEAGHMQGKLVLTP